MSLPMATAMGRLVIRIVATNGSPWIVPAALFTLLLASVLWRRPLRLASAITLMREEAIATCCALALAEDELTRLGQLSSAAEMARTFQLVEGRLLVDQALDSSGS